LKQNTTTPDLLIRNGLFVKVGLAGQSIFQSKIYFMKKLIAFLLLLTISACSFSQSTHLITSQTKTDYLQKSKLQKKTGLILLLGGTACVLVVPIGVLVLTKSYPAAAITMAVGLIAIPASIPFLVAASRNKKKALSLSFKNETAPQLQKNSFINRSVPSLSLKISL
jgi:hypothetical protein